MGIEQKPAEQLTPQDRGARYKASKVNTAILDLVDRVKKGIAPSKEKVQLGTVSDANAAQIQRETGIDARGYYVAIEARQIEHILKRFSMSFCIPCLLKGITTIIVYIRKTM